ncbi:hypothetical protein NM208_g13426 [Fusarium decemcellulare]|uniref:Uncharacterized protein n=1 Tax=Fusarium decemcellulare TaxID=57161 RepID=A0ACC1RJY2_9HYPO|nr:hypothetical protein NM208_g13426 [Fusarium decemcellulare]
MVMGDVSKRLAKAVDKTCATRLKQWGLCDEPILDPRRPEKAVIPSIFPKRREVMYVCQFTAGRRCVADVQCAVASTPGGPVGRSPPFEPCPSWMDSPSSSSSSDLFHLQTCTLLSGFLSRLRVSNVPCALSPSHRNAVLSHMRCRVPIVPRDPEHPGAFLDIRRRLTPRSRLLSDRNNETAHDAWRGQNGRLASVLACVLTAALAQDDVTTSAESDVPEWGHGQRHATVPIYQPGRASIIQINGDMIAADQSNYNKINKSTDVAYISCDEPKDDSFIEPDKILNDLMQVTPKIKAIVLYSTSYTWCSISYSNDLPFTSILSMTDSGEATQALNYLNRTRRGEPIKVSITGNTTDDNTTPAEEDSGKSNPAVAMSILCDKSAPIS